MILITHAGIQQIGIMGILCTTWKDNKVDIFENILITHSCIQQIGIKTPEESPSLDTLRTERNRTASLPGDMITQCN